ncbi:anti-sigma factor [Aquihabitans sp. McL0605]|uniref:anti-sigma factor n=1 Tax=Aquihabitans sp. McL0605 TaxID=3415671 RepID=UPI003CFA88D0
MSEYEDEFTDLLGAYALDAVDDDEREGIERHLAECPRCRAEVAEHREVAALLSQSGAPAPEGIWDRIASELSPPAPPMRMTIAPTAEAAAAAPGPTAAPVPAEGTEAPVSTVVPIGDAPSRRSLTTRTMVAILGVAAAIVVVLGAVVVIQSQHTKTQTVEQLASNATADSKLQVHLAGDGGEAKAVVGDNGKGYLIMDGVPAPADGDVYQLWGQVDGKVLSLGTFGQTAVVPFSIDPGRIGGIEAFMVTQEQAPGVASSQNPPVMVGTV